MKTEIVKSEEFGIDKKQEKELLGNLPQIKKEREELEKQYSEVIKLDIEDPESWKKARELRLLIRKNRTKGINAWHRTAKDFFLKGGQFVDAIKRKEIAVNERMENQLLEIEKYEEIQNKKEIQRLNDLRISEIEPYQDFVPFGINLGELPQEEYNKVFQGAKMQFEAEQERIKKEEEERQEKIRIEKLHNERKELLLDVWQFVNEKYINFGTLSIDEFENIKTKAYSDKKDYEKEQERIRKENARLEKERVERERAEKERLAKIEAERKKEREEAERKQKELEEKQRKERIEREKLEAEIRAREEAKRKAEKERKDKEEELRKAPIKEQMNIWVNSFNLPEIEINNDAKKEILLKFNSFKNWAKKQVENI